MAEFTPGPWRCVYCVDKPSGEFFFAVVGSRPQPGYTEACVCYVSPVEKETEEDRANANLIAAAPDLYEALRLLLPHAERMSARDTVEYGKTDWMEVHIQQAKAALAKAKGVGS